MQKNKINVNFIKKYDDRKYNYLCNLRFRSSVSECKRFFESNCRNLLVQGKMKKMYFPQNPEIFGRNLQYSSRTNLKNLLEWDFLLLNHYSNFINVYLELKERYEKELLSEQYLEAWNTLHEIEKQCGLSLWLVEQQFGILDSLKMYTEADKLLNMYKISSGRNTIISNIFKYMKWRKSKRTDYLEYERYVNNILSKREPKNLDTMYLKHKIILNRETSKENYKLILQIDETFSLIDLYETVIDTLFVLTYSLDMDLELGELKRLAQNIKDNRLLAMLIYLGEEYVPEVGTKEKELFLILELYSQCKWNQTEKILEGYLNKHPNDFMMNHLYIKSKMYQNLEIEKGSEIQKALYDLYTMVDEVEVSQNKFQNLWKSFYGTTWQYKIEAILYKKILCENKELITHISACYDYQISPMFVKILRKETKKPFLLSMEKYCPESVKLIMLQYGLTDELLPVGHQIKEYYIHMCMLYEKREYDKLVKLGREAVLFLDSDKEGAYGKEHKAHFYYKGRIAKYLFQGLLMTDRIQEAIELFGNIFFQKNALVKRLNISELVKKMNEWQEYEELDISFMKSVYAPIIVHYYYKNDIDNVIIAYRNFLYCNSANSLDEWMNGIKEITQAQIYFLYKVCVPILLEQDYQTLSQYKTNIGIRIYILRFLIERNPDEQKRYVEELNSIYSAQQLEIRVQSVNKDRVHVEIEKIFLKMENFLKNEFEQYKIQERLREELIIDDKGAIDSQIEENKGFITNQELQRYDSEKSFYIYIIGEIVEEYLFNRSYGLNVYIGTRIRHNYCQQNLFSVFEKWHLLSKKEKNTSTEYMINHYWSNRIKEEDLQKLLHILGSFSKDMNEKLDEIRNEWLQIHIGDGVGMFNYADIMETIYNYTLIVKGASEKVFYKVVQRLDDKTKEILKTIRERINTELKAFFYSKLNWLRQEIAAGGFMENSKEMLFFSIDKCKEELNETICNFTNIFNFEDVSYQDFLMKDAIECYIEIFKRLYPNIKETDIYYDNQDALMFKGHMFPHWIDILGILFQNAKEYSGYNNFKEAEFKINTNIIQYGEKDWFVLEANNYLKDYSQDDIQEIHNKMSTFLHNVENNHILEESMREHGSGFYRIARIIKYNLGMEAVYRYEVKETSFKLQIEVPVLGGRYNESFMY